MSVSVEFLHKFGDMSQLTNKVVLGGTKSSIPRMWARMGSSVSQFPESPTSCISYLILHVITLIDLHH